MGLVLVIAVPLVFFAGPHLPTLFIGPSDTWPDTVRWVGTGVMGLAVVEMLLGGLNAFRAGSDGVSGNPASKLTIDDERWICGRIAAAAPVTSNQHRFVAEMADWQTRQPACSLVYVGRVLAGVGLLLTGLGLLTLLIGLDLVVEGGFAMTRACSRAPASRRWLELYDGGVRP